MIRILGNLKGRMLSGKIFAGVVLSLILAVGGLGYLYRDSLSTIAQQATDLAAYDTAVRQWQNRYQEREQEYRRVIALYQERERQRREASSQLDEKLRILNEYDNEEFNNCLDLLLPDGLRNTR